MQKLSCHGMLGMLGMELQSGGDSVLSAKR